MPHRAIACPRGCRNPNNYRLRFFLHIGVMNIPLICLVQVRVCLSFQRRLLAWTRFADSHLEWFNRGVRQYDLQGDALGLGHEHKAEEKQPLGVGFTRANLKAVSGYM